MELQTAFRFVLASAGLSGGGVCRNRANYAIGIEKPHRPKITEAAMNQPLVRNGIQQTAFAGLFRGS